MAAKNIYDMTEGKPTVLLFNFAVPMLIGNLFQKFYNIIDAMIVGNYVSANALGAVGATGSITFLFFSLSFGLSSGIGIIVSQYFGAKDDENLMRTIANSVYILFVASLIMSVIGVVLARPILIALKTPAAILEDAVIFMQVTCGGIMAVAAFNGVAAILRALGDTKNPLVFLILSCAINIVLDLLFVIEFHMGVFGVGIATVISQALAAIACIIYAIIKIPYFQIPREYFRIDKDILMKSIRIGIPVALQNSLIAFSCIFLQMIVNEFGEVVVSANTAVGRFEQLVQQPFNSLGAAMSTFTGQNIGAGKLERVKKGLRSGTMMCAVFSLIMLPVAYLGGGVIMRMFVDDVQVINFGAQALKITSVFYFALGMIYVIRGLLNGAGDSTYAMMNGVVEVIGRVGFAKPLTMIPAIGVWGIWYTTGVTWCLTAVISIIRYAGGKWKRKSLNYSVKMH